MPIRILLADDHALIRHGVRRILQAEPSFSIVAEASSGVEAVEMAVEHGPDIAIIDISMKQLNGIETTAQILSRSPYTRVLILSMYSDERYISRALKAGATGYLLKDSVEYDLVAAVKAVAEGQSYFSPQAARILVDCFARRVDGGLVDDRYELLTERERQIYQMLAEGQSNKAIAEQLNLSRHTIETHRTHIMEKLGVHTAAELVLSAVRRGIIV